MATVHVKLRSSVVEGKPGTLFFVLSHRGNTKQIKTIHKLFPPEWDPVSQHPLIPDNERSMYVQQVKTSLQESLIQLRSLIHSYPPGEPDILQQIVNRFNGKSPSLRLFSFIDKLQKQLELEDYNITEFLNLHRDENGILLGNQKNGKASILEEFTEEQERQ
jgi:hypothetical protein